MLPHHNQDWKGYSAAGCITSHSKTLPKHDITALALAVTTFQSLTWCSGNSSIASAELLKFQNVDYRASCNG
jgi:hypothetical protein